MSAKMRLLTIWLLAALSTAANAQQASAPDPKRAHAIKLLMAAYAESAVFCMEYRAATYVTHIAGVRIDVDCKTRNDFVASLTAEERDRLDIPER